MCSAPTSPSLWGAPHPPLARWPPTLAEITQTGRRWQPIQLVPAGMPFDITWLHASSFTPMTGDRSFTSMIAKCPPKSRGNAWLWQPSHALSAPCEVHDYLKKFCFDKFTMIRRFRLACSRLSRKKREGIIDNCKVGWPAGSWLNHLHSSSQALSQSILALSLSWLKPAIWSDII